MLWCQTYDRTFLLFTAEEAEAAEQGMGGEPSGSGAGPSGSNGAGPSTHLNLDDGKCLNGSGGWDTVGRASSPLGLW